MHPVELYLHRHQSREPAIPTDRAGYQFGTFKGVFTPSILTILAVVMYLRMGWVLGNVGLVTTIAIVTLASAITFSRRSRSRRSPPTCRMGGGGAYFIISRSLGEESGAAIDLPLFLAQALGISFYIAGFSESLAQVFPALDPAIVGLVTLAALTALVSATVFVMAGEALDFQRIVAADPQSAPFRSGSPAELRRCLR